jgi:hypothetical protein
MPDPASLRRQPRPPGGGFWLGLALLVGGVGAVYVFAPQVPKRLFGQIDRPEDGTAPSAAQTGSTVLDERSHTATNALAEVSQVARTESRQAPVGPKPTIAAPIAQAFTDEARAQELLTQANAAYQTAVTTKDWSKATSAARKVLGLQAKPATLVRAKDIIRGAEAQERLFKELDDRDELARNFDTHPSLVAFWDERGASGLAVPIRSMEDKTPVETDPLAWIKGQRAAGKLTLMLKGSKQFSPGVLTADQVQKVERADVAAIIAERRGQFEQRLARLKNSALASNPLAWYDAAKFAYQNRLDDHVAQMMDRALLLDPLLAQSVREDKAAGLFSNLVLHLTNKNGPQAAAFMALIDKKFPDTPSGKEARAFYDSKTKSNASEVASAQERLRAARKDALERAAEEARKRREQRLARAEETGDATEIAAAKTEPTTGADEESTAMAPVSGDEGKADELYAKGRDLYQKAIEAGNSDGRDQLYGEANKHLSQAQNLYNQLLAKTPGNAALEEKAFMCNKLRYGSIKQRRFH